MVVDHTHRNDGGKKTQDGTEHQQITRRDILNIAQHGGLAERGGDVRHVPQVLQHLGLVTAIHRERELVDHIALLQVMVQTAPLHVGAHAHHLHHRAGDGQLEHRALALLHFDAQHVAGLNVQTLGQTVGEQHPVLGWDEAAFLGVDDALQAGLGRTPLQGTAPHMHAMHQAHADAAAGLDRTHMRDSCQLVLHACGMGLDQTHRHIAAHDLVKAGVEQHVNRVAPKGARHHHGHGHRNAHHRQGRAQGTALHVAQHHLRTRRQPMAQTPSL